MRKLLRRISYLVHRRQMDQDLAEEMAAHREMLAADRRTAFGNTLRLREDSHAAWGWVWLERLWQDLHYGCRSIARQPGFAMIAVLSLAVGVGANCAIFSLADTLLLRPLPVPHAADVVTLGSKDLTATTSATAGYNLLSASYPDYRDIRDRTTGPGGSFQGVVAYNFIRAGVSAGTDGRPDALPQLRTGMQVTANFFDVLGVKPELGRSFRPDENQVPGRDAVVILDHDFWEQEFAADRSVVGREVKMSGIAFTVIGVLPARFTSVDQWVHPAFYVPLMMGPRLGEGADVLEGRDRRFFTVKGRLKAGVPISRARMELAALAASLERAYPATNRNQSMDVRTELDARIKTVPANAELIVTLTILAAGVLLVACANVAGLLTSRAPARAREMALRVAIGAGRTRLIRQLITESLLLAVAGGMVGIGVGYAGVLLFRQITYPSDLPLMITFDMNQRALLFSLSIALLSVLLFGLVPAIRSSRADVTTALKGGGAAAPGFPGLLGARLWGRSTLVSGQVAVSLVLLTTTMFLYLGIHAGLVAGPGFRIDHLLLMNFDPSVAHYSAAQDHEFYKQLVERSRSVPGVKLVALASFVPMTVDIDAFSIVPEGSRLPRGINSISVMANRVDENYFETAGIPLVRGRGILKTDTEKSPRVAVINEALATHYWPGQDPIGKRFRLAGQNDGGWVEIVGMAKTTKYLSTLEPPADFLYVPYRQNPRGHMTLMVESTGDAAALTASVREVVRGLDPDLPVFDVVTMENFYRARAVQVYQIIIQAVASMGLMGMGLALAGLYGLMAYAVSTRTREIGIRMAIGANRGEVLRMVLRQGFVLALSGMAAGLVLSAGVARLLRSTFPGDSPLGAYLVVTPAVFAVTMLAAYLPARRASRVDPITALRCE